MYIISECLTCVVVTFTLSAFLFAFCVVLLTIKQEIESRGGMSRLVPKGGMHLFPRPAAVLVREKTYKR
jgi:hypothetical protein